MRPSKAHRGILMGRMIDFPRRCQAFGQDYAFSGQLSEAVPLAHAHPLVRRVVISMQEQSDAHKGVLLNWYDAASKDYIGPHSDDEGALIPDAPIFSLSWCSPGHFRRFRLTARAERDQALLPTVGGIGQGVIPLRNGCLIVMGGRCQKTHKHEIMPVRKKLGEDSGHRINLTLRAFKAGNALTTGGKSAVPMAAAHVSAAATAQVPARERPQGRDACTSTAEQEKGRHGGGNSKRRRL